MNENSTLRYLGEAYGNVCANLDMVWSVLVSDTAIQIYTLVAALAFAAYAVSFVTRSLQDFAGAMRAAFRRT
ncbi:MAG: hypothetical protein LPK88_10455 [Alphaproteobacteria bacterium]|jgi:hypothetical protein|nr:hypothetical protein [Alphaproteobacteria bacterium]MDX5416719.1 hypothetical protein [Alphaproteobacteria bacterium]MDX5494103.1 hypothetical protein [Alphaproteobacteria bacterium]